MLMVIISTLRINTNKNWLKLNLLTIYWLEIKKPPENQVVNRWIVDPQGFEPQMTEPKSVVLPLHHGSVFDAAKLYKLFEI